ncbi:hypothetical protein AAEI00_12900 [Shewanella algae]|uniref:hypothetical protein n=1 Tax=Shewanella algae TaxID=38313 RepID=UPI003194BDBE
MNNPTNIRALFESLANLSVPLERVFHIAITEINNDGSISEKYKEELLNATKSLLFNSLELHDYVGKKDVSFNIMSGGESEYNKIREIYKTAFPSEKDEGVNLHQHIERLSSK